MTKQNGPESGTLRDKLANSESLFLSDESGLMYWCLQADWSKEEGGQGREQQGTTGQAFAEKMVSCRRSRTVGQDAR